LPRQRGYKSEPQHIAWHGPQGRRQRPRLI
jgi:hypothetical protein